MQLQLEDLDMSVWASYHYHSFVKGWDKFVSGVRLGVHGWWDGWTICWEIDAWAGLRGYCGNGNLGIDHKGGVKTFFSSIV